MQVCNRFNKVPEYDDLKALKTLIEGTWNHWIFLGSPKGEVEQVIDWMIADQ